MGYSISWLAVKGREKTQLLELLGLHATGQIGDSFDFDISGQALQNGWFLFIAEKCDHPLISAKNLERLSRDGEVLACSIEEHVMFASATYWKSGSNVWRVEHRGDEKIAHLTVDGTPPGSFSSIRDKCVAKQAGDSEVDWYFEIPLQLARHLVGYKHDEVHPRLDGHFEEFALVKGSPLKPPWKFW